MSDSAPDSDTFNTESARLYFGPVKTPERNFVANNTRLFPPAVSSWLRRSPRLSVIPVDHENAAQEAEDIDLVAQLVNVVGVDDEDARGDCEPDEPLSALADKILHAVDNPSPPPSPPAALRTDRCLTPNPDALDFDVEVLDMLTSTDEVASHNHIHSDKNVSVDLISFDSPRQLVDPNLANQLNLPLPLEDLLSISPELDPPSRPPSSIPAFSIGPPAFNDEQNLGSTFVDSPRPIFPESDLVRAFSTAEHQEQLQPDNLQSPSATNPNVLPATPLRRSTRPRRSTVAAACSRSSPAPMDLPSIARTSIKKKESSVDLEEIVDNPQQERSPSRSVLHSRQHNHRQLGSLSPASTNVLSSLAFDLSVDPNGAEETSACRPGVEPPTFSLAFMPRGEAVGDVSSPVRADGPQRIPSSVGGEKSPKKFRLQMLVPNDAISTPPRRIPIEQALAQGQLSPEKAAHLGFKATIHSGPSSTTIPTPARRILFSDKPPPSKTLAILKYGRPTKQPRSRQERVAEISHRFTSLKGKGKANTGSLGVQEVTIKQGKLPFPILAAIVDESSSSEPHQAVDQMASSTKSPSSAAKPRLKDVTSRIPRINPKPYARKTNVKFSGSALNLTADSKPPTQPAEKLQTAKKPIRLVETPKVASPTPCGKASSSTPLLKRKRDAEKPSKPHTTFLRQVRSSATRTQTQSQTDTSNEQPDHDTIHVRRVVSVSMPSSEPLESASEDATANEPRRPSLTMQSEPFNLAEPPSPILQPVDVVDDPGSPMKQDFEAHKPSSDSQPLLPCPPGTESVSSGLRRTTRMRRAIINSEATTEAPMRKAARRKSASQANDVFSGMSVTALKELTMTNTERNQHYLTAKLETEVIRKEGLRPESPAVKIQTVVQRQQEGKDRLRAERAKRRARKSGNDEISVSDVEDVGYSSPCDNRGVDMDMETNSDVDGPPHKHRSGAGDEEDYVTPERLVRDIAARLFDDGSMEPPRRVKWDRGLYTLVYLDEVKLGSRQTLKENRVLKGILAPTAKALRLDTLGNLLHAETTPLTDLVPENVTVKKFVYDNDVAPTPDPPAPKTTRSKSKRK